MELPAIFTNQRKSLFRLLAGAIASLLLLSTPFFPRNAAAQSADAEQQKLEQLKFKDIEELDLEKLLDAPITIATGRVQRLEDAPSIASVITDEEIRRLGARTLAEVLQFVPGYEVITDNSGRNRIIVRGLLGRSSGGSSENVLILFNGHRLNDELRGDATTVNLDIPVDNIKRIEVIRGPGSALFGDNAFVGVINIITYTAEDFQGVRMSAGGGSFGTQQYNILAGGKFGDFSLSGFVQFKDTTGARLRVPADAQSRLDAALFPFFPAASLAPGRTNDDRSSVDANFQAAYKGLTINGRFKDEHSGSFIGGSESLGNGRIDTRQIALDASYRHPLGDKGNILGKFSFTQNEIDLFLNIGPPGLIIPVPGVGVISYPNGVLADITNNTRRFSGETVLDYRLFKDHHFTLGFGFTHLSTFGRKTRANYDPVTQTQLPSFQTLPIDAFPQTSRHLISLYAQDIWTPLPDLDITAGLRYDHYSDFSGTVDPRIGAVWRFAKDFHLKLLYGSAFRAPSILETSFNVPNGVVGNPNLDPSGLQTFEAALGYSKPNQFSISANYFATFIRDFIRIRNPGSTAGGSLATFVNDKGIDIHGVEFETKVHLWDHLLFANYTLQRPKDIATRRRLADVPSHLGSLGLSLSLGNYLTLTPSAIFRGSRPREAGDPRSDHPGYALFNLTLQAKTPIPGLGLSGTINNLFDKKYTDPSSAIGVPGDYPRPGINFFLKAIYKF